MILHSYYIPQCDWDVTAYYAVSGYDTERIMGKLAWIGCDDYSMKKAYNNLVQNRLNSGLTYSNYFTRQSVMVVALSSSAKEYHQALMHEIRHLQSHIATTLDIDEKSEAACYLLDYIVGATHDVCSPLICGCKTECNRV